MKIEFRDAKEEFIEKLNINFRTILSYGKDELIPLGEFIVKDIVKDEIPEEYDNMISDYDSMRVILRSVNDEKVEIVLPIGEFISKYMDLANKNASTLDIESNLAKSIEDVKKKAEQQVFDDETLKTVTKVETISLVESNAEYFIDGEPQSSNYSICPINLGKCRERIKEKHEEIRDKKEYDEWVR